MANTLNYLTAEQRVDVTERSNLKGLLCVGHAWGVIFASMALFAVWPNPATFLVALVLIGSRQLGLAVLMHDGAHGILTRSPKLNWQLSQWLCAYPVFFDTRRYRLYHLQHHRHTQQPEDPDLSLSAPFPITKASFRRKVIRDLTGRTALKQRGAQLSSAIGGSNDNVHERWSSFKRNLGSQTLTNLCLLGGLTVIGQWHLYFVLWLLPMFTWLQLITRVRNIAEHAMVPDNDDPMRNARTTRANLFERALLAPYWVNYHVEHHLIMYVPCYNLPRMHRYLKENGHLPRMEFKARYADVLKLAMSKPDNGSLPAPV